MDSSVVRIADGAAELYIPKPVASSGKGTSKMGGILDPWSLQSRLLDSEKSYLNAALRAQLGIREQFVRTNIK